MSEPDGVSGGPVFASATPVANRSEPEPESSSPTSSERPVSKPGKPGETGIHPNHLATTTMVVGGIVAEGAAYTVSPWLAAGAAGVGIAGAATHHVMRGRSRGAASAAGAGATGTGSARKARTRPRLSLRRRNAAGRGGSSGATEALGSGSASGGRNARGATGRRRLFGGSSRRKAAGGKAAGSATGGKTDSGGSTTPTKRNGSPTNGSNSRWRPFGGRKNRSASGGANGATTTKRAASDAGGSSRDGRKTPRTKTPATKKTRGANDGNSASTTTKRRPWTKKHDDAKSDPSSSGRAPSTTTKRASAKKGRGDDTVRGTTRWPFGRDKSGLSEGESAATGARNGRGWGSGKSTKRRRWGRERITTLGGDDTTDKSRAEGKRERDIDTRGRGSKPERRSPRRDRRSDRKTAKGKGKRTKNDQPDESGSGAPSAVTPLEADTASSSDPVVSSGDMVDSPEADTPPADAPPADAPPRLPLGRGRRPSADMYGVFLDPGDPPAPTPAEAPSAPTPVPAGRRARPDAGDFDGPGAPASGSARNNSTTRSAAMATPTVSSAQDASTTGTRVEAWDTAERNAVGAAAKLTDEARRTEEQAGALVDKPDMEPTYQRLRREAGNLEQTAEVRRGLARAYGEMRRFVGA